MTKTATVSVRVKPEVKSHAEAVFEKLGITPTDAITMFYHQVDLRQGIPFSVEIPNAETLKAIADTDAGIDISVATSMDELRAQLGI
jgi:DNA-damage-inducible protein J